MRIVCTYSVVGLVWPRCEEQIFGSSGIGAFKILTSLKHKGEGLFCLFVCGLKVAINSKRSVSQSELPGQICKTTVKFDR